MPILTINRFDGGLSLLDKQSLNDNEFEKLFNMHYNKDKRLQTRRGYKKYFTYIPDAVTLINACDSTSGFAVSDDADTLATGTAIRGSFSVSFNINVAASANNDALLTHTTLSADIRSTKGYLGFWLKPPTGFNTNLTAVKVRLGSDASNYYEWTLGTLVEASNNFIRLDYSNASTTGSPADATIAYFRLEITYSAAYTNKTGVLIDDIRSYSATYTKPVTSYFFHQNDTTFERYAICFAGTNSFHWDETSSSWDLIDSGLSEFETATGQTTWRTRWAGEIYANHFYLSNGVDNYRRWDTTTITQYAGQPKYKYLRVLSNADIVFGAVGKTLYWMAAGAADASTVNANDLDVGSDEAGTINGLFELGSTILTGKSRKIYSIDIGNQNAPPIDTQGGLFSHRAIANVENAIVYFSDDGIRTLMQRDGATGAAAIAGQPLTDHLRTLINQITAAQYNANCAGFVRTLNNYYFSFDTSDDNIPETTLVLSSLVPNAWSQYNYPALYQYGYYIDSNGNYHYLFTSANSGIIYEMETGFTDDTNVIEYELITKAWDMKKPSIWKDVKSMDIFGLKSEGEPIHVEILIDNSVVYSAEIDDNYIDITGGAVTIASDPMATSSLGGGGSGNGGTDDMDVYPYFIRLGGEIFGSGQTVQLRMYSDTGPIVWTLDRVMLGYEENTIDIFPYANIG